MRKVYEKELMKLDFQMNEFGRMVVESMKNMNFLMKNMNVEEARILIETDPEALQIKSRIEERCMNLIMRQQPVAADLRLISSALKMVTDLERMQRQIGDVADILIDTHKKGEVMPDIPGLFNMGNKAGIMVEKAVSAQANQDLGLVDEVIEMDDVVDGYFEDVKLDIVKRFKKEEDNPEVLINALMITKYFERIADHAENTVKWVYFLVTGDHKEEQ